MAETGLLAVVLPELDAQRGVPQNKIEGEDLFDHTLRTVDAAPAGRPVVRLAALLHDVGKPATIDDGPFRGHEVVGAEMAEQLLDRLHLPRAAVGRVVHLVRNHMFTYEPDWGDAGVRRFIQRVGIDAIDDLFALREADNVGSGVPVDAHHLAHLRARVDAELAASVVLDRSRLAIDGDDLMTELGLPAGPRLGRILDELLERVIAEPKLQRPGDAPAPRRVDAGGRPMIERLLAAEAALDQGDARHGRPAVRPGRPGRPAQRDRAGRPRAGRAPRGPHRRGARARRAGARDRPGRGGGPAAPARGLRGGATGARAGARADVAAGRTGAGQLCAGRRPRRRPQSRRSPRPTLAPGATASLAVRVLADGS